jgi:Tat protein translocase TatB subunit
MFDLSLAEILLIVVVGIVFIGPKDLPVVIKAIAKAMKNLRGFTHEIKQAFEDISRESGIADVKETLDAEMRLIKGDDGNMYESYDVKNSLSSLRGGVADVAIQSHDDTKSWIATPSARNDEFSKVKNHDDIKE